MADVFGIDLMGLTDLDWEFTPVTNPRLGCAIAVGRRWISPNGSLFYSKTYGKNVRQYLGAANTVPAGLIATELEIEAEKDERVFKATVQVERVGSEMRVQGLLEATVGVVEFTLRVDELGKTTLSSGETTLTLP